MKYNTAYNVGRFKLVTEALETSYTEGMVELIIDKYMAFGRSEIGLDAPPLEQIKQLESLITYEDGRFFMQHVNAFSDIREAVNSFYEAEYDQVLPDDSKEALAMLNAEMDTAFRFIAEAETWFLETNTDGEIFISDSGSVVIFFDYEDIGETFDIYKYIESRLSDDNDQAIYEYGYDYIYEIVTPYFVTQAMDS